ncbi:MAG: hypothetical protein AAB777_02315 [Patescibacteria group bacterium]
MKKKSSNIKTVEQSAFPPPSLEGMAPVPPLPEPKLAKQIQTSAGTVVKKTTTTTKETTSVVPATVPKPTEAPAPTPVLQPQAPKPASTAALPQIQQPVVVQPLQTTAPAPTAQQPVVSNPPVTSEQPVTQGAVPPPQPATPTPLWWKKNRKKVLVITSIIGAVATLIGLVWRLCPSLANYSVLPPNRTSRIEATPTTILGVKVMTEELANLRKDIIELKSRPATVVTQVVQTLQPAQPSSVVMVATNASTSNSAPCTIECKGFGGQTVGIIGSSNIVINGSVTIYPNGVIVPTSVGQKVQQPRQLLCWPHGSEPTRIIRAKECLLSSGVSSFSMPTEIIRAGEDIGVLIPDGWSVKWHSSANPDQTEITIDGRLYRPFPAGMTWPSNNRDQHHELRLRLRGISEASLELTFFRF